MNKKPILLAILLALAIVVAYAGFIASMPAAPEVVTGAGPTPPPIAASGQVMLTVLPGGP